MKLMAIDYGEKRVGVASTDDAGEFALPRAVLLNDAELIAKILEFKESEGAEKVIIGESRNLDQTANPVLARIEELKLALEKSGAEVELHPEMYTTMEAERIQGRGEMTDASAAAIILKSYIDKHKQ